MVIVGLDRRRVCKGIYDANIFASLFDVIPPKDRGTAAGLMNTVGWTGGFLAPWAVGKASKQFRPRDGHRLDGRRVSYSSGSWPGSPLAWPWPAHRSRLSEFFLDLERNHDRERLIARDQRHGCELGYAWARRGDINAFSGLMLDNIGGMILMASLLVLGFGLPRQFVLTRMIPGTAVGVLVGDLIYTSMAFRLARRTGRTRCHRHAPGPRHAQHVWRRPLHHRTGLSSRPQAWARA